MEGSLAGRAGLFIDSRQWTANSPVR